MSNELRDFIYDVMPDIDDVLTNNNTPIPRRFIEAGDIFVGAFVQSSSFSSNDELTESDAYYRCILPIFNEWYYEKYGDLIKNPVKTSYRGVAFVFGQPIELAIPSTTSEVVEEGKLSKMKFPDHLQENEDIKDIIQPCINLENIEAGLVLDLTKQIEDIVAFTRSINIDVNTASNLDQPAKDMSIGIWGHFEKGVLDILEFKKETASIACWEFHLAIEKSLKVLIRLKSGKGKHGHSLQDLVQLLNEYGCEIDSSELMKLPSDKEAIKLRYAETIRQPIDAFNYYLIALKFVADVCSRLDHKYGIKNASFTLKKAPWAR